MWFLFAVALAAAPEGLDLEDPAPFEAAAEQLLDGPAGCWEIVGKATWNHDGAKFGHSRGAAIFAGRLTDGVWSDLHIEPLGELLKESSRTSEVRVYRENQLFFPLLGRHEDDDAEDGPGGENTPENIVRKVLSDLQGSARYSWVEWDDARAGVVYTEVVPVGKKNDAPEVNVEILFPGGGLVPSRGDLVFPDRMVVNKFPVVAVWNGVVQLRGSVVAGRVFPAAEAYSADVHVLGYKLHSAQSIQYTSIRPCGGDPPPVAPAPAPQEHRRRHWDRDGDDSPEKPPEDASEDLPEE